MPETNNWKFELEQYIRQSEPTKAEKSKAWKTAIGLQDVDGLKTSEYLLETLLRFWVSKPFSFRLQSGRRFISGFLREYLTMQA